MNQTEHSILRRSGASAKTRAGSDSQQFGAGFSFLGDTINLEDRQGSALSVGSNPAPLANLGFQARSSTRPPAVNIRTLANGTAWFPPFSRIGWRNVALPHDSVNPHAASETFAIADAEEGARQTVGSSPTPVPNNPLSRSCLQAERIPGNSSQRQEPQPRHCRVRGVFGRDRFLADCFSSTQATYIGRSFGEGFPSPVRLSLGTGFALAQYLKISQVQSLIVGRELVRRERLRQMQRDMSSFTWNEVTLVRQMPRTARPLATQRNLSVCKSISMHAHKTVMPGIARIPNVWLALRQVSSQTGTVPAV